MRCHGNQSECDTPIQPTPPSHPPYTYKQRQTKWREREEDYWSEFGHVWTPSRLSHAPIVQDEAGLRVELFLLRPPGLR